MQFIHQLSSYPPNSRYEPQTPFRTNHTDCFIDEGIHNCAHDTTQTGQLDFIEGNKEADARLRVRYNDPSDLEYFGFDQCALTKQYKKNDVYQVVPLYQTILMPSDRPTPNFCFQMYGTLQTQFYTLDQVRAMINSSAFKQVDPSIDPSKFNFTVGVQFIATRANASLGSRVFQLTDEMKRVFMPEVLRQFVYVIVGLFLVVVILDVTLLLMLLVIRSIGRRQKPTTATSVVYRYGPETSLGRNEIAKSSAEPLNETKPTNQSAEPTADRSLSLRSKPPVEYSAKE
ncbi:hypothetical protein M3Y95_00869200 [Aphelenchoides besseyi]|nr:hypothetical protein M3Y95_00869200 [Aphelenchoides besseyi]